MKMTTSMLSGAPRVTDLGLNIGISLGIMVFAVGMCWDLRKYFWFWIIIIVLLALHRLGRRRWCRRRRR